MYARVYQKKCTCLKTAELNRIKLGKKTRSETNNS